VYTRLRAYESFGDRIRSLRTGVSQL